MTNLFKSLLLSAAMITTATFAQAASHSGWKISTQHSAVYFGSVKKDKVGEVHSFSGISGTVAADGTAIIEIDLSSVNTNVKIRNTRMMRHVFVDGPTAKLTAKLDMDKLNGIAVGATGIVEVDGKLSLGSIELPIKTNFFIVRLSDNKVIASTQSMVMLSLANAGLSAGIDKLMELAKLPSITRVSPVTIRLMLEK